MPDGQAQQKPQLSEQPGLSHVIGERDVKEQPFNLNVTSNYRSAHGKNPMYVQVEGRQWPYAALAAGLDEWRPPATGTADFV